MYSHHLLAIIFILTVQLVISSATEVWTASSAPVAIGCEHNNGVAAGTKLVSGGGYEGTVANTYASKVVVIYDTITAQWSSKTLTTARYDHATISFTYNDANLVLFAGGWNGSYGYPSWDTTRNGRLATIEVYNANTNMMVTSLQDLDIERDRLSGIAVNEWVLIAGGHGSLAPSSTVDRYQWSGGVLVHMTSTSMPSGGRYGMAIASIGNRAYMCGGDDANYDYTNICECYDVVTASWHTLLTPSLTTARYLPLVVVIGKRIVFAGGKSSGGSSSRVDILDTLLETWTQHDMVISHACAFRT
jgi:hypothetical protein